MAGEGAGLHTEPLNARAARARQRFRAPDQPAAHLFPAVSAPQPAGSLTIACNGDAAASASTSRPGLRTSSPRVARRRGAPDLFLQSPAAADLLGTANPAQE